MTQSQKPPAGQAPSTRQRPSPQSTTAPPPAPEASAPATPDPAALGGRSLAAAIARPLMIGSLALGLMITGMGIWSAAVPLTQTVIAPGVIRPAPGRQQVQHPDGGVIAALHVSDGDQVRAGDPLVTLNTDSLQAEERGLTEILAHRRAEQARLAADVQIGDGGDMPKPHLHTAGLDLERARHTAIAARRDSEVEELNERVTHLGESLTALRTRLSARREERAQVVEQHAAVSELQDLGHASRSTVLALQAQIASLNGAIAQDESAIVGVRRDMTEARIRRDRIAKEAREQALGRLADLAVDIAEREARLALVRERLDRSIIRAPRAGVIVESQVHTVGGVITPGALIMDLVPAGAARVLEVRVDPRDIERVEPGLEAQVTLSAYSRRRVPPVRGRVLTVSADRLSDDATGAAFYTARLELDDGSLREAADALGKPLDIVVGMPAEAFIVTGSNTLIGYLLDPLTDTFSHAFRDA